MITTYSIYGKDKETKQEYAVAALKNFNTVLHLVNQWLTKFYDDVRYETHQHEDGELVPLDRVWVPVNTIKEIVYYKNNIYLSNEAYIYGPDGFVCPSNQVVLDELNRLAQTIESLYEDAAGEDL